jgi:sigma-B regulation protein RsbU (phosphoserine phosphatase)
VARLAVIAECLIFSGLLLLVLAGWPSVDSLGPRAHLAAVILAFPFLVAFHAFVKRYLLPRVEHYFTPVRYDERQILLHLGEEARGATNIDHLFRLIVSRVGEALQASDASLFVCDQATGDYLRRASSSPARLDSLVEAAEPTTEPLMVLSRSAFVVRRLRSMTHPLEIGPEDFETWDRFLASASEVQRAVRQKERDVLMQLKARLLMPIRTKDQLVGLMCLGQCRARHQYDATDKEMLKSVASQLALVIENSRLAERLVATEKLRRELELAAEVQRRLLPTHVPDCAAVDLTGFCQPASGVGGDYYDFFRLDDHRVGIAIADVAGKGIGAALQMSTVQATLRSLLADPAHQWNGSPTKMVAILNRLLRHSTGGANYVTLFYAEFDERARRLAYVNAGHNPPILLRPNPPNVANAVVEFKELSCGGTFVGMFEHCDYEEEVVQMQPGDVLVGFTDGLSEALNVKGWEFGEVRIRETLAETARLTVHEIRDEMVRRVQTWSEGVPQHDDLTFIVLKVRPERVGGAFQNRVSMARPPSTVPLVTGTARIGPLWGGTVSPVVGIA